MTDASLEKAALFRASFGNSTMTNANIAKAELGRANFSGADLTGATLRLTNLARANFSNATLTGTDFHESWTYLTRFEGTDLSKAKNLTQHQLTLACGDDGTTLPDGLIKPTNWPCPESE